MLDWALNGPLTPALAAPYCKVFFKVVRSDNSSYHIEPYIQLKFPEG